MLRGRTPRREMLAVVTTLEMSRLPVETVQTATIVHLLFNKLPNFRQAFMISLSLATVR